MLRHALPVLSFFIFFHAQAQYAIDQSVPVKNISGTQMKFPWAGGFNNAQFSSVDLNGDGILDLFVFDRNGDKVYTFLNHGTVNTVDYTYAPEYESHFPEMENWALLVDYNCDNIEDIFTFTNYPATGIRVFRGFYDADNTIQFAIQDSLLEYQFNNFPVNLFVSSADIPAIVDVNHDGDLDVLTFQINGGYVMYFENTSKETGNGCNGLDYKLEDNCWGDFFESGLRREDSLNVPCPFQAWPAHNSGTDATEKKESGALRHTGSTLLSFDNDGDNIVELITGDISFTNLEFLHNGGTLTDAHMDWLDTVYPSQNVSADIFIFPAAFWVDVDNDGLKDLLAAPNWQMGSENYKCVWYYKNEGTPITADFQYQTNTFFIDDMIEVGEGAQPVFFDVDNDGLQDLLIGNHGYFDLSSQNSYVSQIAYYRNTGDATHPAFQLITSDFANIASLNVLSVCPTFADLDGDGDSDMLSGRDDGTLLYFKNVAAPGSPANFVFNTQNYAGIDVGNFSVPQLVDVNEDGLIDLLIGERDGNVNYYRNTGSASEPVFTLENAVFGGVDVRSPGYLTGYSVPYLVELEPGAGYTLLVGSERGYVYRYTNIDGNLAGNFTKSDSIYSGIKMGLRSSVSGADVDGDGKIELLVGNYRGGVTYYNEAPNVVINPVASNPAILLYPNPSAGNVHAGLPQNFVNHPLTVSVFNYLGEEILTKKFVRSTGELDLDLSAVPDGAYLVRFSSENFNAVGKLMVKH